MFIKTHRDAEITNDDGDLSTSIPGKPDLIRDGLAFLVNHSNDGTVCANVSLVLALSQAVEAHPLLEERLGRNEKLSGNRRISKTDYKCDELAGCGKTGVWD